MSKKTKRPIIQPPKTFTRSHIGINPNTGEFEFENLPPTWVAFFRKAGIKKKDLADKETRDKVFKLMAESHVVNEIQKEVNNNPNAAKALRNTIKPAKKLPEGMTVTPITDKFIKEQKEKEVNRTLKQCQPSAKSTSVKQSSVKTEKTTTKDNQLLKPSSRPNCKKPSVVKNDTSRGKVAIPKAFSEKQQEKPLTYYEKMQLKEKEKPKTFDANPSPTSFDKQTHKTDVKKTSHVPAKSTYDTVSKPSTASFVDKKQKDIAPKPSVVNQNDSMEDEFKPTIIGDEWSDNDEPKFNSPNSITKPVTTPNKQTNTTPFKKEPPKPVVSNAPTRSSVKPEIKKTEEVDMGSVFSQQKSQLRNSNSSKATHSSVDRKTPLKTNTVHYSPKPTNHYPSQSSSSTFNNSHFTAKPINTTTHKPSVSNTTTSRPSGPQTTSPFFKPSPSTYAKPQTTTNVNSSSPKRVSETKKEEPVVQKKQEEPIKSFVKQQPKEVETPKKEEPKPSIKAEPTKPILKQEPVKPIVKEQPKEVSVPKKEEPKPVIKEEPKQPIKTIIKEQPKEVETPKKEEPKPVIKEEPIKPVAKEELIKPENSFSFMPPPPPPALLIKSSNEQPTMVAAGISFTDLIFAQSGNLKQTEIEERKIEEDEVIVALRDILTVRRKDMNMEENEEEDEEDDWSDDW